MTSESSAPVALRVLILRDDSPGHYNQSEAIVQALSWRRPVAVERKTVRRPLLRSPFWLGVLARLPLSLKSMVRLIGLPDMSPAESPDLLISAGGRTLAANVFFARSFGCKNVFSGSVRDFDPLDFSLVLHIDRARETWPNHAITLKPAPFPSGVFQPVKNPPQRMALLLGGPVEGCALSAEDLQLLIDNIGGWQVAWTVVNSRRTPTDWSEIVREWSRSDGTVTFHDFNESGAGGVSDIIAAADACIVTADSTSMISECVALQRPTIAYEPAAGVQTKDHSYLDDLKRAGHLVAMTPETSHTQSLEEAVARITPLEKPAIEELADILVQRLEL